MLLTLLSILIVVGVIYLVITILETHFPTLWRIWRAAILATIVLAVVRVLGAWLCGFVCRP
jgi:hypothetical protein